MDPIEIISRYYPHGSRAYDILLAHSRDVCVLAIEIAERHRELSVDIPFIREASMLHDIGIFMTDAPSIGCLGAEPYIRHGYLGAELLRSLGYPRHALVAERHTGTGLTMQEIRMRGIDLPEGIYMPISLEEQIICYADKFYSKTKLGQRKTTEQVRQNLLKHGTQALERFEVLHERFARFTD